MAIMDGVCCVSVSVRKVVFFFFLFGPRESERERILFFFGVERERERLLFPRLFLHAQ